MLPSAPLSVTHHPHHQVNPVCIYIMTYNQHEALYIAQSDWFHFNANNPPCQTYNFIIENNIIGSYRNYQDQNRWENKYHTGLKYISEASLVKSDIIIGDTFVLPLDLHIYVTNYPHCRVSWGYIYITTTNKIEAICHIVWYIESYTNVLSI